MQKRLQGLIAGVLIGVTLACGGVFAASTTTLHNVIVNGIKIVVDGQKIIPTDANGNTVEPFIYNGTTYLPVRAVASTLGKAVYWDGPNYTVYLGNMNGELEYPTIEIEDMISIDDSINETNLLTDNYGNSYEHAIRNYQTNINLEYLCNMKYSKFKGTLYVPKRVSSDDTRYLTIIADGKTIYKSTEMAKTSAPVDIDVNITGYNDIQIKFSDYAWNDGLILCLGNAGFYQ